MLSSIWYEYFCEFNVQHDEPMLWVYCDYDTLVSVDLFIIFLIFSIECFFFCNCMLFRCKVPHLRFLRLFIFFCLITHIIIISYIRVFFPREIVWYIMLILSNFVRKNLVELIILQKHDRVREFLLVMYIFIFKSKLVLLLLYCQNIIILY